MNWYIGQKVVALESTPITGLVKDAVYTVLDMNTCSCGHVRLFVGKYIKHDGVECSKCGKVLLTDRMYHQEKIFAPIEEHPEMSEYTADELLEELEPITA